MMVLHAGLPNTLIASNFERYDPNRQDGRAPVRFVPEAEHVSNEKNNEKSLTVTFEISATVKRTYKILSNGSTEEFINHIKVHKKQFWLVVK